MNQSTALDVRLLLGKAAGGPNRIKLPEQSLDERWQTGYVRLNAMPQGVARPLFFGPKAIRLEQSDTWRLVRV